MSAKVLFINKYNRSKPASRCFKIYYTLLSRLNTGKSIYLNTTSLIRTYRGTFIYLSNHYALTFWRLVELDAQLIRSRLNWGKYTSLPLVVIYALLMV